MLIADDEELLKQRRCKTIIRRRVQDSRVKHLGSGERKRASERVNFDF